jgi:hypothetical protein
MNELYHIKDKHIREEMKLQSVKERTDEHSKWIIHRMSEETIPKHILQYTPRGRRHQDDLGRHGRGGEV